MNALYVNFDPFDVNEGVSLAIRSAADCRIVHGIGLRSFTSLLG